MRVAINGFGRIGRNTLRNIIRRNDAIEIVAINDLADVATLAHLFRYDSVHGPFEGQVAISGDDLVVNGKSIRIVNVRSPQDLPWDTLDIDVVVESTGKFTAKNLAAEHLKAGAKKVLISAPSPDKEVPTIVLGVNDETVDWSSPILSNASCTTNNVAPLIKVLDAHWKVIDGYITTVHSMTGDQNLHDAPHKDLRRARAASSSIIPTTTGAAKAVTNVFPHLDGKLGGAGIRVPVLNGSLTDFTCILERKPSVSEINNAFAKAAENDLKGILQYTEDPIVSIDIVNSPFSCIFDAQLTSVVGGLVKVVGWYDNEFGYSNRLVDLLLKLKANQAF
ncbi:MULTISPECIES: type I glyceraldehyde-3-phosphate dehydrogenase [Olivibacter]|uniref:Type I glyceraldehyde-3-phosphate dehydrogenase n=2 Tax=Olivibacter TaxID=376469 RepID=A0ABV6HRI1_9SPHI|nr:MULTISPECIES: type I glyceraldehyde-3-phosphate dehydrogenase [Olivibacter]MCL4640302.1 type I glyceraldehyde-3-phosphate dehydrogenase [Olivibacter sp. UJ_SKK_5.1]MDM8174028.1 type I glyceraldehyde-3-phosphate dehydrogenase [Olivibacter sp. 47]MDX3916890.1 type I glyceraldehyde-3-phosphate dehydrogenase [Pseudosphingobacterium sp.]QEL03814.1 type I glyceraldehyde-3-phosphate dehydrogenase [Olivibacter sp. LS-1]